MNSVRVQCSVCALPEEKRVALDAALSTPGITLDEIAAGATGISKASLHRHRVNHLRAKPSESAEQLVPEVKQRVPSLKSVTVMPSNLSHTSMPMQPEANKRQLLERLDWLWDEGTSGLENSKAQDDLRCRVGFLKELRSTAEARGLADGSLSRTGDLAANLQICIVVPDRSLPPAAEAGPVIGLVPLENEVDSIDLPVRR